MTSALILWIIVGLIASVLAWLFMPSRAPVGIILTIIVGIVGAVIGLFILEALHIGSPTFGWKVIEGIIGAVIPLLIYRTPADRRRGV